MAISAYVGAPPVADRPPIAPRRPAEPEPVLAALMVVMLLIGVTAFVLAAQAARPPAAPNQRPVEGWVGTSP